MFSIITPLNEMLLRITYFEILICNWMNLLKIKTGCAQMSQSGTTGNVAYILATPTVSLHSSKCKLAVQSKVGLQRLAQLEY